MSSFASTLLSRPAEPLSPLARYTQANGIFYLVGGLAFLFFPPPLIPAVFGEALTPREGGLLRALGMTLALIGWFYVFGARTGRDSFCLSTVVDRALVPFVLVPLWLWGGLDAVLALPFAVLDPALALGAYLVWRRSAPGA